jgi:hypothetical protein
MIFDDIRFLCLKFIKYIEINSDLIINFKNVIISLFYLTDPSEFYCQNEVKIIPVDLCKESISNNQFTLFIAGVVAFIISIVAILVHQLYSQK